MSSDELDPKVDPDDQRENGSARKDPETRKRVDEIANANELWRQAVDDRLTKALRWAFAGVGIAILAGLFAVLLWAHTSTQADANAKALCAYRGDLEERVKNAKQFLEDHPEGLPGIQSAADLKKDTDNRERVVAAFRYLTCP